MGKRFCADISSYAEEIIEELNEYETLIMTELGRMSISVKKNISEETLKNKLPDDHIKNFSKNRDSLKAKGLIVKYRPGNYGVPKLGRIVARKLLEKSRNKKYNDLNRILLVIEIK